jgi:hypothetical protein
MADINTLTGGIFEGFKGWMTSGVFWMTGAVVLIAVVVLFYAYMNKRGKLKYSALELVNFGNGKVGVNKKKAGVFGTKSFLGLIDYGNEKIIKVDDGRRVLDATTDDLHDIFGKRGFILRRKDDDPRILVPVSKVLFINEKLLFEIAPADFRDTSVNILTAATKETESTWEKILPYVAVGLIVVLTIISIIVNQQMTNNTVDKVGKMLIQGCSNSQSAAPGAAP